MEPTIQMTGGTLAVIHARRQAVPLKREAATITRACAPDLTVPERGATGPIPIGEVMNPLQRIITRPDRGRLLAKFCEQHNLL